MNPEIQAISVPSFPPPVLPKSDGFRWQKNKASSSAVQYLTALTADQRRDGWEHLIAILLTATKTRYIPENIKDGGNTRKYTFATTWLTGKLAPYQEMDSAAILEAAANGDFRYLGRAFWQKVANKIRDVKRFNRKHKHVTYNDAIEEHQKTVVKPLSIQEFDEFLNSCPSLDCTDLDTADALWNARFENRGGRARSVAQRFNISPQAANKRIRKLQKKIKKEIEEGNKSVQEFAQRLAEFIEKPSLKARDLDWSDFDGTAIQTRQFESSGIMKARPSFEQDLDNDCREFNEATLYEGGRGYSWKQRNPLHRIDRLSQSEDGF